MTETAIARTGVIGLGAMGLQMARHMAAKGFEVCGTDIDHEAMRRASAYGVRLCGSAAEVGDLAEIVVLMNWYGVPILRCHSREACHAKAGSGNLIRRGGRTLRRVAPNA